MTKDELYKEFVSVTHFDASKIPGFNYEEDVRRITSVTLDGVEIISDCEGIAIIFHSVDYSHTITYFHKEVEDEDKAD